MKGLFERMGHPLLDLKNKTAVVIGGTSGIGLALSKGLAQAGANVVPTGRRADHVRAAAEAIGEIGSLSLELTCDVMEKASLDALLGAVCKEFGGVQILVNCAGRTQRLPTIDFPEDEWKAIIDTNLNGRARGGQ